MTIYGMKCQALSIWNKTYPWKSLESLCNLDKKVVNQVCKQMVDNNANLKEVLWVSQTWRVTKEALLDLHVARRSVWLDHFIGLGVIGRWLVSFQVRT